MSFIYIKIYFVFIWFRRYEKELQKPNKSEVYRDLARQQINSIREALPQLE
jgi:hypothetical protein